MVRPDGNVVAIGGRLFDGANNWFAGQSEVEVYNPTAGTWTTAEPLAESFFCDTVALSRRRPAAHRRHRPFGNGVTTTFAANQRNTAGPDNWDADPGIQTTGRFRQACVNWLLEAFLSGGDDNGTVQLIGLQCTQLEAAVPRCFPTRPPSLGKVPILKPPRVTPGRTTHGCPLLGMSRYVSGLPAGMYLLGMENDGVPVYRRLPVR